MVIGCRSHNGQNVSSARSAMDCSDAPAFTTAPGLKRSVSVPSFTSSLKNPSSGAANHARSGVTAIVPVPFGGSTTFLPVATASPTTSRQST